MVSEECPCRLERFWLRQGRSSGGQPLEKVLRGKGCNRSYIPLSHSSEFTFIVHRNPVEPNSAEEFWEPGVPVKVRPSGSTSWIALGSNVASARRCFIWFRRSVPAD